jgi:hypothetical protein
MRFRAHVFLLAVLALLLSLSFLLRHETRAQIAGYASPAVVTCTAAPPGMVSWWPGEGNGNDIRGENNGTPQGGSPVTFPAGEVERAFQFVDASQRVVIPDNASLDLTNAVTIDAWVSPQQAGSVGNCTTFVLKGNIQAFDQPYGLFFYADRTASMRVGNAGNVQEAVSTTQLPLNTFTHLAGTYDGTTIKIYVNGVLENSVVSSIGTLTNSTFPLVIGSTGPCPGGTLAEVDEVELFNRALDITEIQAIFNAGSAGKCKPRCATAPTGMVSWWDGDDDPFDRQGTNHGTLQGGATFGNGKVGRAFKFAGNGDVDVPFNQNLDPPSGRITVDAWVNPASVIAGAPIVNKRPAANNTGYTLEQRFTADGTVLWNVFVGGTSVSVVSNATLPLNTWTHVAGTYDGATSTLYFNGTQVGSTAFSGTVDPSPNAGLQIGRNIVTGALFDGLIDEVEVFNRALSQLEVQAINNAASAGKCKKCIDPTSLGGLVGFWGGDANTFDASGFGNHGNFLGTPSYAIGEVSQAFHFDGTANSGVVIPSSTSLNPTDAITLDGWVKPFSFPNTGPAVIRRNSNGGGTTQYSLNVGDGINTGVVHCNIGGTIGATGGTVPLNQWTHVACTYDRQNLRVYVNGVEVAATAGTTAIPTSATNLAIGKEDGFTDRNFDGLIDEAEVFNNALSPTAIQSLVAAGPSGKCKTQNTPMGSGVNNMGGDAASILFNTVTNSGQTTYQNLATYQAGPMPFGYNAPLDIGDVSTLATFTGGVKVCFLLPAITDSNLFKQLRILHLESNDLVNRTSFADVTNQTLCANVTSLSPFVIAQNTNAPTAANGNISGTITDSNGAPVSGVTINLSGSESREAITDSSGKYGFDSVETNGFYTVTPSRANYTFNPANRSFSLLGVRTEASFTANANADRANAIDTIEFFVRQHYLDFLNREPDPPGFIGWVNTLRNCAVGDASCDRVHVSEMFYRSQEFQERGYFVYRFYATAFGRKPDYAEFAPDLARVSGFLTNDELGAAKTAFIDDFMSRPAFARQYDSLSETAFVDRLLQTAGVDLSNRQALIDALRTRRLRRAEVLRQIAESGEVYQKYYNQAFVVMEYFGYLHREPDALYLDWIRALDANPADSRRMVDGFVNSTEYRQRFGP